MMRVSKTVLLFAGAALFGTGLSGMALAQDRGTQNAQSTPKGWNYEIKDGKRVPKGNRVANADGSWREEVRQGACVTVKEKTATGEYRETRRCD
jgi:hypothetical protein